MAGFSLAVDLSAADTLAVVTQAARKLNYAVLLLDEHTLALRKGSVLGQLLGGPAAVYCDFRVSIKQTSDGKADVLVEPNRTWWTGVWGMRRARARAEDLTDLIASDLRERGAKAVKHIID